MLIDAIQKIVTLSKKVGIKGSDPLVKELMTTLRRSGFSSHEISELSGWRWSGTLVRQYTKDWLGVDEKLNDQRKTLMTPLREMILLNKDIVDVENFLRLEKSVKTKNSSLEEMAELNSNLGDLDLHWGEVGKLVELSRELLEKSLNLNIVQYWMRTDSELSEAGFNKQVRMYLAGLCRENGGVYEVVNAVRQYIDLNSIRSDRIRLVKEVEQLNAMSEQLNDRNGQLLFKINNNQELINAAGNAALFGFDAASLMMISVLSENLGGPYKVATAIQKYQSIPEIEKDLNTKQAKLNKLEKEINDKSGFLSALEFTLTETKNVYERNSNLQQVVRLLVDPRGLKMDRIEIAELLALVLYSSIIRLDESLKLLESPDPIWDDIVLSIKTLANRLHQFTQSKTG